MLLSTFSARLIQAARRRERSNTLPLAAGAALLALLPGVAQASANSAPSTTASASTDAAGVALAPIDTATEAQYKTLFTNWKKLDVVESTAIAIPSMHPVTALSFTSNFGVRSDPFRGTATMHAGVDIPGPLGTPIYATADGVIARAERAGGYGNLVEINHGKGIETRYGHLSKILVAPNTRVRRGQLIALMGSTGRSTGSHLHYEVRLDGHAVNPAPFLQTADYVAPADAPKLHSVAMGGPIED